MPKKNVFTEARCRLLYHFPFFGSLALYLKDVESKKYPHAATDGRHLWWNPDWFESLDEDQQMAVVAHEVLHPALGHVYRWRRGNRHPELWNIAGDFVINQILKDSRLRLWEDPAPLLDEKFKDMSTEEIYSTFDRPNPNCGTCSGRGFVPMDGEGGSTSPKKEDGDGDQTGKGKFKSCPNCGGSYLPGGLGFDIIEDADGTTEEEQKKARQWTERLVTAAQSAKQRGTLPAGMERMLDELLNPRLPWTALLSQLVAEATRDDYTDLRYDRRMLQYNMYFPDIHQEKVYAVVAIDTSGSMSTEEITDAISESWGILRCRNVTRIRLLSCDADVHYDKTFYPQDQAPTSIPGGGGTDFKPIFKKLAEGSDVPACLIYFTDLFGSFPESEDYPGYPVFWVTKTPEGSTTEAVPFGKVLQYES